MNRTYPVFGHRQRIPLCLIGGLVSMLLMAMDPAWGQDFRYSVEDDEVTITGYVGSVGPATIPETIDGLPVTGIAFGAFRSNGRLTGIVPASPSLALVRSMIVVS